MAWRRPRAGGLAIALMVLAIVLPHAASATPEAPAAPPPTTAPVAPAAPAAPAAPTAPAATTGFVTASGTGLSVDGHPWKFVGYNMPCAQPFLLDPSQLNFVVAAIANNSGANALRVWFFQQNGGPQNWAPFDRLVAAAKADGIRLIPTLVNEWATCEANPPITIQKTLGWFQDGYRRTGDGYKLSFHDFAVAVAAHYADDPTIAFWQLVNEATDPTLLPNNQSSCDEPAAAQALRSFADDMTNAIHAVDPRHLVSLGTLGGSQCGTVGGDYQFIHAGAVNICEYHDYADAYNPLETDRPDDGLATRLHQCQTLPGGGKPFFVGEAGIAPNIQTPPAAEPANCGPWPTCSPLPVTYDSLTLRASLFKAKISASFGVGVSGYLIWFKGPHFSAANDSYAIGDGDPAEAMMASLSLGTTSPVTVPDPPAVTASAGHRDSWTNSPILLVVGGGVLIAAWVVMWRSRRRPSHLPTSEEPPPSP